MKLVRPFVVLPLLLAFGCASSNYAGLARRGASPAELEIVPTTSRVPDTVITEIKNDVGQRIATEETIVGWYDKVTGFSLQHAGKQIDEQDFYELAGDRNGVDAVERARARGRLMNRAGIFVMAAGTAAAIAVPVTFGRKTLPYAVTQWFFSFSGGLVLAMFGERKFTHTVLPASRAFGAIGHEAPEWAESL